ncbi:hypothetical protein [Daejeonella lutea]|uniref:Uncharacterized protein n=1 Tax=Daejeonella lutea TaxID=572036 RepID=A0A1T5B6C4_9SPHI|nr:hypothetical protein [Daejeonella lutea]SKB42822.1 hypothetical protein SAMN05661099_1352 [Daejeonella lutea]
MKTIYTLSTIVLIALSLNSKADDKIKNRDKSATVSVAPFVWGDPEDAVPAELKEVKKVMVPVAPFVWGSPEDAVNVTANNNMNVPVAPFIYGNPNDDAPEGLASIKAVGALVPAAPFVLGEPGIDIPMELERNK